MFSRYLQVQIKRIRFATESKMLHTPMRKERYELEATSDAMTFEFTSVGPKGEIPKMVIYSPIELENFYNLGFGDKDLATGDINDLVVTDNKDSQKVLATVAFTVYAFTNAYPDALVIAEGSTKARTRLYQMSIANNLEEIKTDFLIWGEKEGKWHRFEKNVEYDAFLIKRKMKVK